MAKTNNIRKELLKQMERDSDSLLDTSAKSAWKIIGKHRAQLRKLKWIAATSWIITFVGTAALYNVRNYVLKHNLDDVLTENEFWLIRYSDMTSIVLLVVCALLTYLAYVKSKTLTVLQICTRLANIEEQLKQMSQEKSADSEA